MRSHVSNLELPFKLQQRLEWCSVELAGDNCVSDGWSTRDNGGIT